MMFSNPDIVVLILQLFALLGLRSVSKIAYDPREYQATERESKLISYGFFVIWIFRIFSVELPRYLFEPERGTRNII